MDPDAEQIAVHDLAAGTKELCEEAVASRVVEGFRLDVARYFATCEDDVVPNSGSVGACHAARSEPSP